MNSNYAEEQNHVALSNQSNSGASSAHIIGLSRSKVRSMFEEHGYHRVKSYEANDDGFNLDGKNGVEAHVIYDKDNKAKGVDFFSLGVPVQDDGSHSYVYIHYNDLIAWVTGEKSIKIKNNQNSKSMRAYPSELYIGDDDSDE